MKYRHWYKIKENRSKEEEMWIKEMEEGGGAERRKRQKYKTVLQ